MAFPTAKRSATPQPPAKNPVEVVDPRWLFTALALTVCGAAILGYLTLCLLIYQGSWQLFLTPSQMISATPSIPFQPIHFDSAETGAPRLTGWWIPAEAGSPGAAQTILYLHDGIGSLSSNVRKLDLLHRAGRNIFAIDYRGFGQSDPQHPTEARMAEDAAAALDYLVNTRHISPSVIVPYGEGLAATLAVHLANTHLLGGVIVDTPDPAAFTRATASSRSRWLPMHLLVRERFDISAELADPRTARLLLSDSPFGSDAAQVAANQALFERARGEKFTVTFNGPDNDDAYLQSVTRFLDDYVPFKPLNPR